MKIETDEQGGRIFFSSTGRSLEGEDEICILSVGVDIGSSTSHLVFSRIVLERFDSRYVVVSREVVHQSRILLTPYTAEGLIDADAPGIQVVRLRIAHAVKASVSVRVQRTVWNRKRVQEHLGGGRSALTERHGRNGVSRHECR